MKNKNLIFFELPKTHRLLFILGHIGFWISLFLHIYTFWGIVSTYQWSEVWALLWVIAVICIIMLMRIWHTSNDGNQDGMYKRRKERVPLWMYVVLGMLFVNVVVHFGQLFILASGITGQVRGNYHIYEERLFSGSLLTFYAFVIIHLISRQKNEM